MRVVSKSNGSSRTARKKRPGRRRKEKTGESRTSESEGGEEAAGRNERWCGGRERDDSAAMYRIGRKDRWDMNERRWMRSKGTRSQVSEGSLECGED